MTFRAGQPVVWGDLPFVIVDASNHGTLITAVRPFGAAGSDDGVAFTGSEADVLEIECAWFALCDHTATSLEPHPVLGDVPICDRCREKNERLRG